MLSELEVREAARRSMMASHLSYLGHLISPFLRHAYIAPSITATHRPFLTFAFFLFLFLSFSRYPMASHSINQYPSSVPGTSSRATMVRFSGGSPSTDPPAGHEYTSSLPEYTLGDIPTISASHAQYQWQPLLPTPTGPTSDSLADSHVSQVTGPPHIRLMYSSSMGNSPRPV